MRERTSERGPLRQFRVTVTESVTDERYYALLAWRTFPCVADHWDGVVRVDVSHLPAMPIVSQEALREVLAALAAAPWPPPTKVHRRRP